MTWVEEIATECLRLAGAGNLGLMVTLAILFVAAVVITVGRRVGAIKRDPEPAPTPDAQWNTDPSQGAVVVPGPPGGSDDQNLSG